MKANIHFIFFPSAKGEMITNFLSLQLLSKFISFSNFIITKESIDISCFLSVARHRDPKNGTYILFLKISTKKRRNTLSNVKNKNVRKDVYLNLSVCFLFWKKLNWLCIIFGSPVVHLPHFFTFLFLGLLILYLLEQLGNSSLNHIFLQTSLNVLRFKSPEPTIHFIPQENKNKMLLVCVFTANLL